MKLKFKIFLTFTAIATIPLIIISVFTYRQYIRIIDRRMAEIISVQLDNLSQAVDDAYTSPRQALGILTFFSDDEYSIINILKPLSDADHPLTDYEIYQASIDMRPLCQKICYTYGYISGIYIFTPSGSVISHETEQNGRIPHDYDPSGDEWYQETMAMNGKIYISTLDCHPLFQSDEESIFLAQSLRNMDTKKNLGVIVMDCKPELFDLSSVNALGDMNLITLVNTDNQSVFYTNKNENTAAIANLTNPALVEQVKGTPFELSLIFDRNSLVKEYNIMGIALLIVVFLCLLGIILLTYGISHSLVRPIQQLSQQMLQQRTTHLTSFPNYEDRKDEIGILYREYNSMVEELYVSIKRDYQNKLILLDAQMKALEARINSHFLFNTLESINSMAELADQDQISTMSLALGNMFRYAIKTKSELVTIRDELNHVLDYIAIQKIRYDNRFHLEVDIPGELLSQKVLKLILQPVVENAFSHGLNFCADGNQIRIHARMENSQILISVSDNGRGMPAETLAQLKKSLCEEATFTELGKRTKQSIGLKNIQSRIELYYGKGYGLSLQSRLEEGTTILIRIPTLAGKDET